MQSHITKHQPSPTEAKEISILFYTLQNQIMKHGYREVSLFVKAAHNLFTEMYNTKAQNKIPTYK